MRELTPLEAEELEKYRKRFPVFVEELAPVLTDFADRLGLQSPETIVTNPDAFLEPIDDFMKYEVILDDDRNWILARLAYFIGQIFIQRFGGEWMLNEIPESRFFLRYVIGRIPGARNPYTTMDPFLAASIYLEEPPGRSLTGAISEAEREMGTYWDGLGTS